MKTFQNNYVCSKWSSSITSYIAFYGCLVTIDALQTITSLSRAPSDNTSVSQFSLDSSLSLSESSAALTLSVAGLSVLSTSQIYFLFCNAWSSMGLIDE